ncbi:copper transporter [Aquipuribacter sp. SD81]|uniref:copper transporter n=1 Tax=Aquipuribacter sp. SD81 TaxID=3127703 RepID=UPI0030165EC9
MIDLRHHVVSLVAVLVALAVGVTLGAGPLREPVEAVASSADLQERAETATAERDRARTAVAALDRAAATLAARAAAGSLEDSRVLVVALPGAPASQVARLSETVGAAGGEVTATLRLGQAWVDPARAPLLSSVAAQVEPLVADGVAPADPVLLGAGLATALLAPPAGEEAPSSGTVGTVLGLLTGGELGALEVHDGEAAPEPADAVLLLAGPVDDLAAAGTWVDVVTGLAARGPVVVAEDVVPVAATGVQPPPEAASVVVQLRRRAAEDPAGPLGHVSSVDTLGAEVGRWSAVLAVAGAGEGRHGGYGLLDSADGPVPATG